MEKKKKHKIAKQNVRLFKLTAGTGGSKGVGGQRGLLPCESGIELAPGFFQSVVNRFVSGFPELGLPLRSTCPMLSLSLGDAVLAVTVVVVVKGALLVDATVVVGEVWAEMVTVAVAREAVVFSGLFVVVVVVEYGAVV